VEDCCSGPVCDLPDGVDVLHQSARRVGGVTVTMTFGRIKSK
jgi:hypothetical protein